jgi:hypothetical protein
MNANLSNPVCRSDDPAGCAQCSAAYACYDRRLGRPHLLWAPIALTLLVLLGLAMQL